METKSFPRSSTSPSVLLNLLWRCGGTMGQGDPQYTWDPLRELQASGGMTTVDPATVRVPVGHSPPLHLYTQSFLTHDAVCAVGSSRTGGCAVVIGSVAAATTHPSVEAGHGRKAGADVCRRVGGVALWRQGTLHSPDIRKNKNKATEEGAAHQSVVRVDPAVGGALGGAMGWVPTPQHAAMVTLLTHTATTVVPGVTAVVTIWWRTKLDFENKKTQKHEGMQIICRRLFRPQLQLHTSWSDYVC